MWIRIVYFFAIFPFYTLDICHTRYYNVVKFWGTEFVFIRSEKALARLCVGYINLLNEPNL